MNRPASFDAALLDAEPYLRYLAGRYVRAQDRDDLVQATMAMALARWEHFRPSGSMRAWLGYAMRTIVWRSAKPYRPATAVQTAEPTQEHAADIGVALSRLREREREAVLGWAQGYSMAELGETMGGISKQRVEQIIRVGRQRLVAANDNEVRRAAA